jgi:hypothetical protein
MVLNEQSEVLAGNVRKTVSIPRTAATITDRFVAGPRASG